MKMMKKFSLLVAIALLITVGGVYATWNYLDPTDTEATDANLALELVQYQVVGGSLSRYGDSNIRVRIDDKDDQHDIDVPDDITYSGALVMIFKSEAGSNDETPASMRYNITLSLNSVSAITPWEYNGAPIFTVTNATVGTDVALEKITDVNFTTASGVEIVNQSGYYYLEITAAQVESCLGFTEGITLNTVSEWNAFDAALRNGNITLTFTPVNN